MPKMHYTVKKINDISDGIYYYTKISYGTSGMAAKNLHKVSVSKKSDTLFEVKNLSSNGIYMHTFSPCECDVTKHNLLDDKFKFRFFDKNWKQIFVVDNTSEEDKNSNNTSTYHLIDTNSIFSNKTIEMSKENLIVNLSITNAELQK